MRVSRRFQFFFLRKNFDRAKKHQISTTPLRSFYVSKKPLPLLFFVFLLLFVSWFLLVSVFYAQNLFVKKTGLKSPRYPQFTILLTYTPSTPLSTTILRTYFHPRSSVSIFFIYDHLWVSLLIHDYSWTFSFMKIFFICENLLESLTCNNLWESLLFVIICEDLFFFFFSSFQIFMKISKRMNFII